MLSEKITNGMSKEMNIEFLAKDIQATLKQKQA